MNEIIETALLAGQLSKLFADGYQWCDKDAGYKKMQAYSASRSIKRKYTDVTEWMFLI